MKLLTSFRYRKTFREVQTNYCSDCSEGFKEGVLVFPVSKRCKHVCPHMYMYSSLYIIQCQ